MKKAFSDCQIVFGTRQPKAIRNLLIRSKFSSLPTIITKQVGLFNCRKCIYHEDGYIKACKESRFGPNGTFVWKYSRYFNCNAKNVVYIIKCNHCSEFYIGETNDFKKRVTKHKSDVIHPENSNCKKLMTHLRKCSNFYEPYFTIFPVYYVEEPNKRRFIEKRFIHRFRPTLTSDT